MEFKTEKNRIYWEETPGLVLAEVTFPDCGENAVVIDHTFVDPSLRGQGVAGKLLAAAAEQLRREGKRARPACSYATKWFAEHPEAADLLLPE